MFFKVLKLAKTENFINVAVTHKVVDYKYFWLNKFILLVASFDVIQVHNTNFILFVDTD